MCFFHVFFPSKNYLCANFIMFSMFSLSPSFILYSFFLHFFFAAFIFFSQSHFSLLHLLSSVLCSFSLISIPYPAFPPAIFYLPPISIYLSFLSLSTFLSISPPMPYLCLILYLHFLLAFHPTLSTFLEFALCIHFLLSLPFQHHLNLDSCH